MRKEYTGIKVFDFIKGSRTVMVTIETVNCKFCGSDIVVKNGIRQGQQYFICKVCGRGFVANRGLPHMRYPIDAVANAVYSYYTGLSLSDIKGSISQTYNMYPSDSTIYRWIIDYSKKAIEEANKHTPDVGDVWIADETVLNIEGKNYWLFDIIDSKTRFLLATHLAKSRTIQDVQKLMESATKRANKIPKVILTDKLRSYIDGIELTYGSETKHVQSKPFAPKDLSTNKIERFHGTLKERTKVLRGFKNLDMNLLDGWLVYYNFLRPHSSLKEKTPAEKAGVEYPFKDWKDVVLKQSPINHFIEHISEFSPVEQYRKRLPYKRRNIRRMRKRSSGVIVVR